MTTTKNKKQDAECDKLRENIEPIVAFAAENRGFSKALLERLQARCAAKPPSRQAMGEWLRPSPKDRKQPRYGMGAVLVEEATALMATWNGGKPNGE